MNEEDRRKIKRNLVFLEKRLKVDERFQRLVVQKKIFSQVMIDDILEEPSPSLDFCMKLMLRGPKAYQRFLDALVETEQFEVLQVLEPGLDVQSITGSNRLGVTMRRVSQPVQNGVCSVATNSAANLPASYERQRLVIINRPNYSNEIPDIPPANYGSRSNGTSSSSSVSNYDDSGSRSNGASSSSSASNYDDSDRDLQFESNGALKIDVRPTKMDFYRRTQEDEDGSYQINLRKPRGRVLIININSFDNNIYSTRVGSETDVTNLDQLFRQLNYTVNIKLDVNAEQFESELRHFAQREDHGDSCFVFILSHGDDLGNGHWGIATRDGKKIDTEEVISNFSSARAKSLINKPKVIVVNACRGHTSDKGVAHQLPLVSSIPSKRPRVYNDGNNESPDELNRTYDDMMYVKSTAFGFASHREENKGSWLIMALCHIFAKESCELDVEKMFKNVDKKIKTWRGLENQRQTIECSTRGLNKALYLYPGL